MNLVKNKQIFFIAGSFILSGIIFLGLKPFLSPVKSTPVSNLRDQLSSAQLSYFARLDSNNTENNSLITVTTNTGSAPSNNNYNLFIGDTLAIAKATTGSTIYTVSDVAGTNAIFLNTGLNAVNTFTGAYVIATRSATHTITFSPESSITEGKWQVLLRATSISGENPIDGMPDQGGFDAHSLLVSDITCPWGSTASVGTTTVVSGSSYHLITCSLPTGGSHSLLSLQLSSVSKGFWAVYTMFLLSNFRF